MTVAAVAVGVLLAWANGANDNFKGVATLFGSRTLSYRSALIVATAATLAGSVASIVTARILLVAFTGKGLVSAEVAGRPAFAVAVALAAAVTVLAATRTGMPISTTHALIGALLGAGWIASSGNVDTGTLAGAFLLPLAVSPVVAVGGAAALYVPLRAARRALGVRQETCVCVGERIVATFPGARELRSVAIEFGDATECRVRYRGAVAGIRARPALDAAHVFSAAAVSFARGLNDTPKIAALLLVGGSLAPGAALVLVGVAIACGGWLAARRVARTMSLEITGMNPGQGFTANLVTAATVIVASRFGLPVSTTHVSCGSLFGIGAVSGRAHWPTIVTILLAWGVTLPSGALLGALFAGLLA